MHWNKNIHVKLVCKTLCSSKGIAIYAATSCILLVSESAFTSVAQQCWTWSGFQIAIQPNSAIQSRTRCQAKFLTCYCFSVISLLRIRK